MVDADVVVIGGGVAGLTAARRLATGGLGVVLLEARPRLGGRIETLLPSGAGDVPIELGAEFVHGWPPAIRRAHLRLGEVPDRHLLAHRGRLVDSNPLWKRAMELLHDHAPDERSFRDHLRASAAPRSVRRLAALYVEGFHGAPVALASARAIDRQLHAAEAIEDQHLFRPLDGYATLVDQLASDLSGRADVRLSTPVVTIVWRPGLVHVQANAPGERLELRARAAIVTVPLPVLADNVLRIVPEPPQIVAARRLAFTNVIKVVLRFARPFWPDELAFVHERTAAFPTWWSVLPLRAPILVGWAAGPKADALGGARSLLGEALSSLARIFGSSARDLAKGLEDWQLKNWRDDPWARGAYSWVPVGATAAAEALASPAGETLWFAGEAAHALANGTVHGAIESGERAAAQLLARLGTGREAPAPTP